jgi:hypothetical protein
MRTSHVLAGLVGCVLGCASLPSGPRDSPHAAEVMVVATIHKAHLVQPGYPLGVLGQILERYQPDLVLVEVRVEPFARGELEDGPFEMAYVVERAHAASVAVEPIDWWDAARTEPTLSVEQEQRYHTEVEPLETRRILPPDFAQAHSDEQTQILREIRNAQDRVLQGNPIWRERQAWVHHLASVAIAKHGARRVLAFVGQDHRPELVDWFTGSGLAVRDPRILEVAAAKDEDVGDAVVARWRGGLSRLKAQATAAGSPNLAAKIRYFEVAIEQRGRCCVAPTKL